jgi:hypothetical protein
MIDKDPIILEQAYQLAREAISSKQDSLTEEEANNLILGFNMRRLLDKTNALNKLKALIGKEIALSKAIRLKQSSGYGRDDGSAPEPGEGGSVAHTETQSVYKVFAQGTIQDVKVSQGERDYTLNGNLILTIGGQDYNVNQGTTVKIKFP